MDRLVTITIVVEAVVGLVRVVLAVVPETHPAVVVLRVLQTAYRVVVQAVAVVRIPVQVGAQVVVRGVVLTHVQGTARQAVQVVVPVGVLGGNCD